VGEQEGKIVTPLRNGADYTASTCVGEVAVEARRSFPRWWRR